MQTERQRACIGIGSNLADPVRQVVRAFEEIGALPDTVLVARSSLYRTAPMGKTDQPDFVNAVACVDTALAPHALLDALMGIEGRHGRVRDELNGPRTLDLDLLLYGGLVLDTPGLVVPHPRMHERAFVLRPLCEVDAALEVPGYGPVSELAAQVIDQPVMRIED